MPDYGLAVVPSARTSSGPGALACPSYAHTEPARFSCLWKQSSGDDPPERGKPMQGRPVWQSSARPHERRPISAGIRYIQRGMDLIFPPSRETKSPPAVAPARMYSLPWRTIGSTMIRASRRLAKNCRKCLGNFVRSGIAGPIGRANVWRLLMLKRLIAPSLVRWTGTLKGSEKARSTLDYCRGRSGYKNATSF